MRSRTNLRLNRTCIRFFSHASSAYHQIKSGQAIHENRPHRILAGQLTPEISALQYYDRRIEVLQSIPNNSFVIIPGNELQFGTGTVFYEFRQDPNFYYLTGFLEPSAALVLYRQNSDHMQSIFYVTERDSVQEMWEGEVAGTEGAVEIFNADAAYSINKISSHVQELLVKCTTVYADITEPKTSRFPRFFKSSGLDALPDSLADLIRTRSTKIDYWSANELIEQLRCIKSENEIVCMRRACEISAQAFNKAYSKRFTKESDLHAFMDYEFRIGGCEMPAYLPVVAGGSHSLTIHYTRNDDILRDGELVLVDAGGRYGGYCADITRTWPVNGKFSEPQKDLYQAVLNVQKHCIELCKTSLGGSLQDIHAVSESLLYTELLNAGLTGLTRNKVRQLYPHSIGHHVGIDVHD